VIGDFARIYRPFTLAWECGSDPRNPRGNVDNPSDKGGRTSRGITQRTYDGSCVLYGWPAGDVWDATDAQVEEIYRRRFWDRVYGDAVGWPLCGALFDSAVLHQMDPLVRRLQQLVGAEVDGRLGLNTIAACSKMGWVNTAWLFLQARDDRYEEIVHRDGTQAVFYKGWEARLDALTAFLGIPRTLDPVAHG
jgi:lysozyme family protein